MDTNVVNISDIIFVNDRRYAHKDWENAFVEFHQIVEMAKHCTQRLRIGMINIEYHPNKHLFTAYGSSYCTGTSIALSSIRPYEQLRSSSPHKISVSFGFACFATERRKKIWRVHLHGFTLIFLRNEQNKLDLIVSGTMPRTSPVKHKDCS